MKGDKRIIGKKSFTPKFSQILIVPTSYLDRTMVSRFSLWREINKFQSTLKFKSHYR